MYNNPVDTYSAHILYQYICVYTYCKLTLTYVNIICENQLQKNIKSYIVYLHESYNLKRLRKLKISKRFEIFK